jgi:hypothetical protein
MSADHDRSPLSDETPLSEDTSPDTLRGSQDEDFPRTFDSEEELNAFIRHELMERCQNPLFTHVLRSQEEQSRRNERAIEKVRRWEYNLAAAALALTIVFGLLGNNFRTSVNGFKSDIKTEYTQAETKLDSLNQEFKSLRDSLRNSSVYTDFAMMEDKANNVSLEIRRARQKYDSLKVSLLQTSASAPDSGRVGEELIEFRSRIADMENNLTKAAREAARAYVDSRMQSVVYSILRGGNADLRIHSLEIVGGSTTPAIRLAAGNEGGSLRIADFGEGSSIQFGPRQSGGGMGVEVFDRIGNVKAYLGTNPNNAGEGRVYVWGTDVRDREELKP